MIEDKRGARQADVVLTTLRSIASWVHKRDNSYIPPFLAREMRRASQQGRDRILNDDEIRRLWSVADKVYPIGPLAQLLLLTAQRRQKLCALKWDDIQGEPGLFGLRSGKRVTRVPSSCPSSPWISSGRGRALLISHMSFPAATAGHGT